MEQIAPTYGGQAVKNIATGRLGITTDVQAVRTPTIGVMYLGAAYSVREQIDQLTVVELQEVVAPTRTARQIAVEAFDDLREEWRAFGHTRTVTEKIAAHAVRIARSEVTR